MTKSTTLALCAALLAVLIAGCAGPDPNSVRPTAAPQTVQNGTVVSVREVTIAGTPGIGGAIVGGVAGAALGSQIGGGSGKTVAATAGAVAGANTGARASETRREQPGVEVVVRLESGQQIAITQLAGNERLLPGDPVQVISGGGTTRVQRVAR
jgi:outer membrane lipoprotein SlyB